MVRADRGQQDERAKHTYRRTSYEWLVAVDRSRTDGQKSMKSRPDVGISLGTSVVAWKRRAIHATKKQKLSNDKKKKHQPRARALRVMTTPSKCTG